VNVLALYHDMKRRGVRLEAKGESMVVDAPAGALTGKDRASLAEAKPVLLRMLATRTREESADDGRQFDARLSRYQGFISLHDPLEGEWHDFPAKDCYPSIVDLANRKRRKA
jgi:hypothetical protein